jgi:hypothetical protein
MSGCDVLLWDKLVLYDVQKIKHTATWTMFRRHGKISVRIWDVKVIIIIYAHLILLLEK